MSPAAAPTLWKNSAIQGRLSELDSLRAAAILQVILYHYFLNASVPTWSFRWLQRLIRLTEAGAFGVDLFFVLSGFLISGILMDHRSSQRYFQTFYGRRVFRIIPLYAALLFLVFVILRSESYYPKWTYMAFVQNFPLAKYGRWDKYLDVTWSLAVEEHMYLLLPSAIYFLPRKWIARISIASLAICPILRWLVQLKMGSVAPVVLTPLRFDTFAVGILLAMAVRSESTYELLTRKRIGVALLSAGLLMAAVVFVFYRDDQYHWLARSFFALGYGGALISMVTCKPQFLAGVLPAIGNAAYSLYLFHNVFFSQVQRLLTGWPLVFVAFTVTIVSCLLIYRYIEAPLIRFASRRFRY